MLGLLLMHRAMQQAKSGSRSWSLSCAGPGDVRRRCRLCCIAFERIQHPLQPLTPCVTSVASNMSWTLCLTVHSARARCAIVSACELVSSEAGLQFWVSHEVSPMSEGCMISRHIHLLH